MNLPRWFCLVLVSMFVAIPTMAWADIEVSGNTPLTANAEYDRNPSITYNGDYWLFYVKGDDTSTSGVRGGGYDPDADTYVVYYKTASTIAGLASATEVKLALSESARPSGFSQRVVSATWLGTDLYAFVSSGQDGTVKGLYYYKWDGASWTGPTTLIADGTAQGGHVNVTSDANRVYIVWEAAADASSDAYTWDPTGGLSAKIDISNDNQPKITLAGATLYVVSIEDGTTDIEVYSAAAAASPSFSSHSTAIAAAGFFDPCIFSDGTDLYVVTAPYDAGDDQQYLVQTKYSGSSWSTHKTICLGGYGGTYWWDFWPCGYHDGFDPYVFFTTETGSPTFSDGEIAMVKMDWDLGEDHYFYIQNAVDEAGTGEEIHVLAGSYEEQVTIDGKTLDLVGDGAGVTVIECPAVLAATPATGSSAYKCIVGIIDDADAGISDLTIDGLGRLAGNSWFVGVGIFDADGSVTNCRITGMHDTPWGGDFEGTGVYGRTFDVVDRDVSVSGCTFDNYQAIGVYIRGDHMTASIDDNTMTGQGPWSVSSQEGIRLVFGPAGSISGNTLSAHSDTSSGIGVAGILLSELDDVIDIKDNTISENEFGIWAHDAAFTAEGNNISATRAGTGQTSNYELITAWAFVAKSRGYGQRPTPKFEADYPADRPDSKATYVYTVNNNILDGGGDWSWGIGLWTEEDEMTISGDHNVIRNCGNGIGVQVDGTGTISSATFNWNAIYGNSNLGILSGIAAQVDAEYNWWGHASGPSGAGPGSGDGVSSNIDYDPWIGKAGGENIVFDADPEILTVAASTQTVDVKYLGGATGRIYGYNVKFSWDPAVVTTTPAQVTEGDLLSDLGDTWMEVSSTGTSEITVHCVLLGDQPGAVGPGTMFSIEFDGFGCGTSAVDLTVVTVRDKDNQAITGFYEDDGEYRVDIDVPVFTVVGPWPDSLCFATAPVLDLSASDACSGLDDAFYRIDGGAWTADGGLFTNHAGAAWTNAAWTVPGFAGLGQGTHTVEFYCTDDFGNVGATVGWDFIKDTVFPPPATGFAAAPGHDKTHLSWTNPGSDFDHVVVVRKAWAGTTPYGYPDYTQPAAGYPTGPTDGTVVYSGTATTYDDDPVADRSIYFYRIFSHDCAGNFTGGTAPTDAVPAAFAQGDRTTSYWLGDVASAYDGYVDFSDISILSGTYWLTDGAGGWNGECDIGPTDDWSRVGIPLPDDVVDFEDLLIFAMNHGVVGPTGKASPPVVLAGASKASTPTLRLVASEEGESDLPVRLVLAGNDSEVKGASVEILFDASVLEFTGVVPSDELQTGPVFFIGEERTSGSVTIDLAALGMDRSIGGSGDLAVLSFTRREEGNGNLRFGEVILRNVENGDVGFQTDNATDVLPGAVPTVTRLVGAAPNPFNPTTTIGFELNEPAHVSVVIYDAQGRMVRTLVDESRSAGAFDAIWNGRDDRGRSAGSGVYFVRMVAGEYSRSAKVVMLR